jgi:hypothetical protein
MRPFWYSAAAKPRTAAPLWIGWGMVKMDVGLMANSFYRLHTPISAVALGFLTTTLFEYIPVGAIVHIRKEYQESGLVELCWGERCYMTYINTVRMNGSAVSVEDHSAAADEILDPNFEKTAVEMVRATLDSVSKTRAFPKYRPLMTTPLRLSLVLPRF